MKLRIGTPNVLIVIFLLTATLVGNFQVVHAAPMSAATLSPTNVTTTSARLKDSGNPDSGNNLGSFSFSVAALTSFDFDLAISPNSLMSQPGQTQTASVSVNPKSGTPQPVTLTVSGQPFGVVALLTTTNATPPYNSTLTLVVSNVVTSGTYTITVTGSGGGQTHSSVLILTISQAPDFHIDVNPASQSVKQGQTATYSVSVVGSNGFDLPVSLSVSGLPSGAKAVFSLNSEIPDFSPTLNITLPSSPLTGSFTLTIKGSGGGLDRTANVMLIIETTSTQSPTASTGGAIDMLQQSNLLIIAALIILFIMVAAIAMSFIQSHKPSIR